VTEFKNRNASVCLPFWLKVFYTLFVMLLVPVYWIELGVANFLWGSDIALVVMVFGLWSESRFLTSMMAVGVLIPELYWNIDFFTHLIAGKDVLGLNATSYIFSGDKSLLVRGLSLFHVFLPVVLLFSLRQLGYDSRGFIAQLLLTWVVLPASYLFTEPAKNINWVFGIREIPQTWMPEIIYLLLLMILFPLLIFWPTHLLLKTVFKPISKRKSN
jgi:hypothetical protein